ncbi:MAG: SprT-like domain-containing protein [Gemmatimonadaceae bacterium]|nr:SprT-like domain-containing protein [Gemmatimonadaceae bacterium]
MRLLRRGADPAQLELALAGAPRTAEEMLARLRTLGLRRIDRCTLTRNRTVMVSVGGGEIRVHEGYLDAPEPVLRAIVVFMQGRTRAERRDARRAIIAAAAVAHVQPRPPERTHPDDEALVARLQALHVRLNAERFDGTLRAVPVRVSRRMRSRLGHYVPAGEHTTVEIVVSRRHIQRDGWDDAVDTLLHEMVHQWQDESGLRVDHRATFRRKAREVGATPAAKRVVDQPRPPRRLAG